MIRFRPHILHALASAFILTTMPACAIADQRDSADNHFDYYDGLAYDRAIKSPSEFLDYELGSRFSRHADVLAYCDYLAQNSDRVTLRDYGRSHQNRRLVLLTVSSAGHIANLDSILEKNRALSDPETSDADAQHIIENNPAVVWLSYNVHGNEPSPTETALQVAYTIATATNEEVARIREGVVLAIDPCLNPDGRERYVSFIDNNIGRSPNADPNTAEHDEPWPQGRTNHYLFDLNRDWVWLIHPESRSRLHIYREYMPQLHIDYHEQGHENPYFFGEGDTPYNANIPQETKDWIKVYGEHNAEVFDDRGIVFSTKERFDYLYPGYGKVMPVYHGAIGMLCEKGGHSRGGVEIDVHDHYTLTLEDRIRDHFLTSMSYLETTSDKRKDQLERFRRYFVESMSPADDAPKAFFILPSTPPAVLEKIFDLCDAHGIRVLETTRSATLDVNTYETGEIVEGFELPAGTWMIRSAQPKGRLALALFERSTHVEDHDTYDITAWCMPVSFGADCFYTNNNASLQTRTLSTFTTSNPAATTITEANPAIAIDSAQHHFPVAMGLATKHGIFCRFADDTFVVDGTRFERGSLIAHRTRNEPSAMSAFLADVAMHGLRAHAASTTMTSEGPVLGADSNGVVDNPRVLLLRGSPMSALSFGQHWHLMDIESPIPHAVVNADRFGSIDLDEYNVLVVPDAFGLGTVMNSSTRDDLKDWVRSGGAIVASGASARWITRNILEIESSDDDEDDQDKEDDEKNSDLGFDERYDKSVVNRVSGALLRADIDTTHPMTGGVRKWLGVIKRGRSTLDVGENGYVVARFAQVEELIIGGAISEENADKIAGTPFVTHHRLGRGNVVCFAEDITMRGFNHAAMRLLLNAITLGPSL